MITQNRFLDEDAKLNSKSSITHLQKNGFLAVKFKTKKLTLLFCMIILLVANHSCEKEEFMSIYGIVLDYETNKPVEGATVSIFPSAKWITTKSDGYFEFNDIDIKLNRNLKMNGTVTAMQMNYISGTVEFTLTPGTRKEVNIKIKKY